MIGTHVRGQMVGEFPGLAQLDADDNLRATADFRGALLLDRRSSGSASTPARVIPDAAGFGRAALIG